MGEFLESLFTCEDIGGQRVGGYFRHTVRSRAGFGAQAPNPYSIEPLGYQ